MLLACVFEEFRSISYETYGLDCAHHFTASNLAGDAFKRVCKADVELLTDRDHLDMVEKRMRGGVVSIFEKRQCDFDQNGRKCRFEILAAIFRISCFEGLAVLLERLAKL